MTWLSITEYLYHKYVRFVVNTIRSFLYSRVITGFVTRVTRGLLHVERVVSTLPEHLSSPPVLVMFMLLDL
jgi:hypothetical protein